MARAAESALMRTEAAAQGGFVVVCGCRI